MRVISNTFSLTAVPDVQASRPNLVHCSQFTKDRLGWWILPDRSNAINYGVMSGQYGINGYNVYQTHAKPGMIADVRQYLAKEYRSSQADYNNETNNYALDAGKWYTLSFKVRGIAKKKNSDGSYSDGGETRLYVYLVGYNGGGVTIVDTSEKYIVDGVEKSPSGDMNTSFVLNWTVSTHTITFKTRSDLKTISNHAAPVLYFRSFGEGHTTYPTYFANGGCLFRIAAIKIEEGMEATAYTPHATEMQPPVHAVAFKRENTDISGNTPTGGTYTSPTPTGWSDGTPTEWSDGIPTGEARLWETKAVFVPELPSATWSKPSPVGDTSDSDVEFSPYDGTPVSDVSNNLAAAGTAASLTTNKWFDPVRNAGADFSKMIWRAERQKKNGTWGSWAIVKVKGEKGEKGEDGENGKDGQAGKDAVTLDLDNQMDSISVDSDGNVKLSQTATTHATIFKGATAQSLTSGSVTATSINGVDAEITYSGGIATISYTFQPASDRFDDKHYTSDISVTYGGVTYKATFTLAPVRDGADGKNAVIYNVHPSLTSCPFSRTSTNDYSPTRYLLTCGYVCNNGGISTTVANATGSFNNGWHIFYRRNSSGTWGDWNLYEKAVSAIYFHSSVEFCIAKTSNVQELIDDPYDSLIVDRETVPVVVGGSNGSNGTSAFTVDLDNEMDAIPCNHNGYLGTAKTYNLNIAAYLGTTSLTLTGCAAEVSPLHPCITVDTGIGDNTETTLGSPIVKVSPSTFTGTYTITFICKTDQGTRNVVFTLVTQRAGSPGESPTIYQLAPSHTSLSYVRDGEGNLTGSNTLTCKMKRTTGSSTSETDVSSSSTYYIYYGYDDAASPSTRLQSSGLTVSASDAESRKNVVLELWNGSRDLTRSVRLDRETIPILKDGSKGENGNPGTPGSPGADATIAWLDCPYLAIQCDKDGISKVASFNVKAYKRVGDNPATTTDNSYKLSYKVRHINSSDETVEGNTGNSTNGTLIVNIEKTYKLKEVVINLYYSGNIIQTITLLPVLDGALGADGYSYLPQVLGEYSPTQEYKWDESVRQGCYYATDGRYNIYYVRKKQTTLKGIAPNGTPEDENWEQSYRIFTIFTDAIYTPNANIGGFYLTRNLFMSSEKAREYIWVNKNFKYYGKYSKGVSYTADRDIIYSGGYYLCKIGHTSTSDTPDSDFWTNLDSITTTNKKEYLKKAVVGKPRNVTITDGVWISAVCDIGSGYMTVKYNRNGGWMVFVNNGTSASDPSSTASGWRYLTETECAILGITSGVTALEYNYKKFDIPRYALNGVTGTPTTFLSDDSVWTYNNSGKLIIGKENRLRVELSPKEGGLSFFNNANKQVITVDASTLSSSNMFGSSQGSFTTSTVDVDYYEDSAGSRYEHYLTYQVTDTAVFTGQMELTYKGEMTAFAGLPNVSVTPRSYCNLNLCLCKYDKDSNTYQIVKEIVALYSGGIAKRQSISGSVIFNGDGGTYCLCLYAQYWQRYSDNRLYYSLTSFSCGYSAISNVTRVYANGFALGNSSTNHFAAFNDGGNIHVKGITNEGKYGYELDATYGMQVRRGTSSTSCLQGLVPPVVFFAYIQFTANSTDGCKVVFFNTLGRTSGTDYTPSVSATSKDGGGYVTLTLPTALKGKLSTSNCFVSVTGINSANVKPTVRPFSGGTTIIIDMADDSSNNFGNFQIKIEYFG